MHEKGSDEWEGIRWRRWETKWDIEVGREGNIEVGRGGTLRWGEGGH